MKLPGRVKANNLIKFQLDRKAAGRTRISGRESFSILSPHRHRLIGDMPFLLVCGLEFLDRVSAEPSVRTARELRDRAGA
jgi:hypothetical protein